MQYTEPQFAESSSITEPTQSQITEGSRLRTDTQSTGVNSGSALVQEEQAITMNQQISAHASTSEVHQMDTSDSNAGGQPKLSPLSRGLDALAFHNNECNALPRVREQRPFSLNYECVGEATFGRVRRAESEPCDLFSKNLGSVLLDLPKVLGNVRISSLGHLVHIYCLARQFKADKILEPYMMREAMMAADDQDIELVDVREALASAASGCIHVDLLLQANKKVPVTVARSEDWPVLTDMVKEGLQQALELRNQRLRGPCEQWSFVAKSTVEKFPVNCAAQGKTVVYSSYNEISTFLNPRSAKPLEIMVMIGDGTAGEFCELLPTSVVDGTVIVVSSPPFGMVSESTLQVVREVAEEMKFRLSRTPAKFVDKLPKVTQMTSFLCLGKQPIKDGFDRIDKGKMHMFVSMMKEEIGKEAFQVRGDSFLGSSDTEHVRQRKEFGSGRGGCGKVFGPRGRGGRPRDQILHQTYHGGV